MTVICPLSSVSWLLPCDWLHLCQPMKCGQTSPVVRLAALFVSLKHLLQSVSVKFGVPAAKEKKSYYAFYALYIMWNQVSAQMWLIKTTCSDVPRRIIHRVKKIRLQFYWSKQLILQMTAVLSAIFLVQISFNKDSYALGSIIKIWLDQHKGVDVIETYHNH